VRGASAGGTHLLAREGLRNDRRGGARVLATVAEQAAECVGELAALGDLELAVDATKVRLGGLSGDEQRLRDLTIGEAVGGESRDAQLASASRPVIASRLGLAPAAVSSARAWLAIRRAPQR
jgi:hypothetical protein